LAGCDGSLFGGRVPRWRGVEDDKGRLMVLIAYKANLALRLGVNITIYAMSH
jgi:hypothetical protein